MRGDTSKTIKRRKGNMTFTKEEQERRKATQEQIQREIREAEVINRARKTQN